jgi:hypothetical protein
MVDWERSAGSPVLEEELCTLSDLVADMPGAAPEGPVS